MSDAHVRFPPFDLDPVAGCLLRDGEAVHLRPRTWDVLCYLVARRGELVTKDDLLDAVWSDAIVSEGTLTNSIRELRVALGDDARSPRYIATVHRRGFRFVANVVPGDVPPPRPEQTSPAVRIATARAPVPAFVGRRPEVDRLLQLAGEAAAGATRVVLVRGEAGIGKSTLVDRFVAALEQDPEQTPRLCVAKGRSVGFLQGAPPFLPVLAAIETLATGAGAPAIVASLATHAPDLLEQMPWLCTDSGAPGNRPIRRELGARLVDFFAELSTRQPLALILEDLHDADAPTASLLLALLDHAPPLALIVIATYRPGEAVLAANGLASVASSITAHANGSAVDLDLLAASDVAAYLRRRNPALWTDALAALVHRQSGGNPLFMVTVADRVELLGPDESAIEQVSDGLRSLLDAQLRTLDFAQREMLAAAAAAGVEFSSMVVAAATGSSVDDVEEACEGLVAHARFLKAAGVADWPSGSVGQAYAFRHELYRRALYGTLPAGRRQALHQRIGEALESGYAGATLEVAPALAEHFVLSGDDRRAVKYLRETAHLARRRYAHRESLDLLDRALALVARETSEDVRDPAQFAVLSERIASAGALHGRGSPALREDCEMVAALGTRLPATFDRFFALLVVFNYRTIRADVAGGSALAEQMMQMAIALDAPILRICATLATGIAATTRGDLARADHDLRAVVARVPRDFRSPNARDLLCPTQTNLAQTLCYLDRRDEAYEISRDTITRADWLDDPFERANARGSASFCAALLDDRASALRWASEAAAIAREHAIAEILSIAEVVTAWADGAAPADERRRRARRGLEGLDESGHLYVKGSFLGLVAEIESETGDPSAAAATLAEARAFCDATGARRHAAELCRRAARVEEQRAGGTRGAVARARRWRAEAERIAREQGCALVLRRLAEDGRRAS